MHVVKPITDLEQQIDDTAMQLFRTSIELAGGPRRLVELRRLTWLPTLMEACFVVALARKFQKTEQEIAQWLGISKITVRQILRAKTEALQEKFEGEVTENQRTHIAGALAKLSYQKIYGELH